MEPPVLPLCANADGAAQTVHTTMEAMSALFKAHLLPYFEANFSWPFAQTPASASQRAPLLPLCRFAPACNPKLLAPDMLLPSGDSVSQSVVLHFFRGRLEVLALYKSQSITVCNYEASRNGVRPPTPATREFQALCTTYDGCYTRNTILLLYIRTHVLGFLFAGRPPLMRKRRSYS